MTSVVCTTNFFVVCLVERMQSESRYFEYPSAVHVAISTGQVPVRLKCWLVQVNHSLTKTSSSSSSSSSFICPKH